jgi:hypothetical protein
LKNPTGRNRDLPSWRKDFKAEWKKCQTTPISLPLNEKYRPDINGWVCTCPYFVKSRFLLCKHLVQAVEPVHPLFFLQVERNRTVPFWSHSLLKPLESHLNPAPQLNSTLFGAESSASRAHIDSDQELGNNSASESDDDHVDTGTDTNAGWRTFDERLTSLISTLREFSDGMEYQRQFKDSRMLEVLERDGAGLFRLAENCLSRERRVNSTRSAPPSTWERATANAMFYRTRPVLTERET